MFTNPVIRKMLVPAFWLYEQSIRLAAPSQQPYSTHIPILLGVASLIKPRRIVEFGSGVFSTLSFLDEVLFPSVTGVDSYENNHVWFDQIRKKLPTDSRINLHLVQGDMYHAVESACTHDADMVFIDDSPTAATRVPTVEEVSRICGTRPVVVLHDSDLWRLRLATRKFEYRVSFNTLNPQSCVMWHAHPERLAMLRRVERVIRAHGDNIALEDLCAWSELFSREPKA